MGENNFWILQFLFPPAFAPPLPPSTSNTEASWPPHFAQRSIILTKAPELPSGLSQGGAAEVPHLCRSMCNGLPEQGHLLSGKRSCCRWWWWWRLCPRELRTWMGPTWENKFWKMMMIYHYRFQHHHLRLHRHHDHGHHHHRHHDHRHHHPHRITWGDKSKVQERRLQYWRRHSLLTGANDSDDEELDDDGEWVMVVMPPPPFVLNIL